MKLYLWFTFRFWSYERTTIDGVPVCVRLQLERVKKWHVLKSELSRILPERHGVSFFLSRGTEREGQHSFHIFRRGRSSPVSFMSENLKCCAGPPVHRLTCVSLVFQVRGNFRQWLRRILKLHGPRSKILQVLRTTETFSSSIGPGVFPCDFPVERSPRRNRI